MILTAEQQTLFVDSLIAGVQANLITNRDRLYLQWAFKANRWDTSNMVLLADMRERVYELCPFLNGSSEPMTLPKPSTSIVNPPQEQPVEYGMNKRENTKKESE